MSQLILVALFCYQKGVITERGLNKDVLSAAQPSQHSKLIQDGELLKARQALTLQGAQQVLAILRGKKLKLGHDGRNGLDFSALVQQLQLTPVQFKAWHPVLKKDVYNTIFFWKKKVFVFYCTPTLFRFRIENRAWRSRRIWTTILPVVAIKYAFLA